MSSRKFQDAMPIAPLKIVALGNCEEIGEKINQIIISRRQKALADTPNPTFKMTGYDTENYLVDFDCPRFGTGEGRAVINESIRGSDLFIIADTVNYSETYKMCGQNTNMSPDDHFMDLKRIIMACSGQPKRITVIMPYLYEGRQHIRMINESLDCALALQELIAMGVETIITFDAHDNRVQNAIPNNGFDNFYTSYQFISEILHTNPDIKVDNDHLMIVSPDEGGMRRAVYYAGQLSVDMGMFYRRRDYSRMVNGEHPVVSVEFLGNDVEGKDIIIVDDMVASGNTVLNVARELKKRKARKVLICATFGLFSNGLDNLDKAYEEQLFDYIYTTNLCYCPEELLEKPYYHNVDLSRYIALIIDTLNHDTSVNDILDATKRIQELVSIRNEQ
ncbi:MAG: ribose-phosphate pyrophosphokinase [Butyribacter sp.]|nr:ribose-phosphate pyrophosphokinase [bacterium]MDY3853485.1 ribose-phosphate pyrophosphokinase [Butyribacter sp.]